MATTRGACLCGGVRFEVAEPFTAISYCHCTTCKKLSGGAGTVNGRTRSSAIRILQGEELLRTFQPAEGTSKTFCSECGANLFGGGWPESEQASVRLTALEEAPEQGPDAHVYVRSVAAWETLPDDGVERFDAGRSG
jgi:hypothetical protein